MSQPLTVKVKCQIPWKSNLTSHYEVKPGMTIREFCEQIGIEWDVEALVFVGEQIAQESMILKQDDEIIMMIPIVGG